MNKTSATVLALLAGTVAVAIPILTSIELAKRQGLESEKATAEATATDVLRRTEEAGDQIGVAFQRLEHSGESDPCSEKSILLMRDLDLRSSLIQMVGFAKGDQMICSSQGRTQYPIPLGPVDYRSSNGVNMRTSVELSLAPGAKFIVAERRGLVAVIHPDLPIDVMTDQPNISLGVFAASTGKMVTRRGIINPRWLKSLGKRSYSNSFDGQYVVCLIRSKKLDIVAFAALPENLVSSKARAFAWVLVPIGILSGLVFALAVLYMGRQQLSLPTVLRTALRRKEFFLEYQPIVDLRSREWVGAEALVRWRRKSEGVVSPALFIPAAEACGLISGITREVIDIAARDIQGLCHGHPNFHFSLNFSKDDLESAETFEYLRDKIHAEKLDPACLLVEVSERGFLEKDVARKTVHDIRALGVKVAVDDFGTGYSSLSHLTTLELDYLKIDKSFVDTILVDSVTSDVILHILGLAKSLDLVVIAEGVETEAQALFLKDHGVPFAQGWLFSKAIGIEELVRLLGSKVR